MKHFIQSSVCAVILTLFAGGFAAAQTSAPIEKAAPSLIASTEDYKAATEKLIPLQEAEVKTATEKLEQLRSSRCNEVSTAGGTDFMTLRISAAASLVLASK